MNPDQDAYQTSIISWNAIHAKSTRELALDLNTSQSTICCHLKKIGNVSKLGVWLPHPLSKKNKEDRISIATSHLLRQRNDPFLKEIISGDEKWVLNDNVQYEKQWIDKDESRQPTPESELHGRKVCMVGSPRFYSF